MEFTSIPLIVIVSYCVGEIIKVIFKKKKEVVKLIPLLVTLLGGILGAIIYLSEPSYLITKSMYESIFLGLISGASSTGANQIIKKLFSKEKKDEFL